MRFTKFGFYRHIHTIDIDIQIQNIQYLGPNYMKVKVLYWNRDHSAIFWTDSESVTINKEYYDNWIRVPA